MKRHANRNPSDFEGFSHAHRFIWYEDSLVMLIGTKMALATPTQGSQQILVSREIPALIVKNARVDPHDGKTRGTVYLRFGYSVPLLPHVHVYGINALGRVTAEGCDKLNGSLLSNPRPAGKGHSVFAVNLGNLTGVKTVRIVASAGHNDRKMEDNRIFKLF